MKKQQQKGTYAESMKAIFWTFKQIWKYTPGFVILVIVYGVTTGISPAVSLLYTERLYDEIGIGGEFGTALAVILVYAATRLLLQIVHNLFQLTLAPRQREKLHTRMHEDLFQTAVKMDLEQYDNPNFLNEFVFAADQAMGHATQLLENTGYMLSWVINIAVSTAVLVQIKPIVAVLVVIMGLIRVVVAYFFNRLSAKHIETVNPIWRRRHYVKRVFSIPDYVKEIKCTHIHENLKAVYDEHTRKHYEAELKFNKRYIVLDLVLNISMTAINATIWVILLYDLMVVPNSGMTLGGLGVGLAAIWNLSWVIQSLAMYIMEYHEHGVFLKKVQRFCQTEPKICGGTKKVSGFETLEIKHVSFTYPEGESSVLTDVSMTIRRGEKIAIVGYNGAGKTTLTKLIMHLYESSDGEILYNGSPLSEYDLCDLRNKISAVFQDYRIFAATVAENVVGGELSEGEIGRVQRQRVEETLQKSTFDNKLSHLSNGIDTELTREFSDDGTELSGGEAQKIAIARAFYKDADLIILDEPSSALDPNAEYELNTAISEYAKDKTIIFISHRLSTTRHADRVYMFDGGHLIECGTHDELMAQNGKYAYMFNLQAEKYRKDMA